ncbi:carbamoyltransferase HypF [Thermosulfurimonas marina]|uniref:Carbamoyltransferase n=1 Tax=Thermosulfurimonas marina TaxID=2047767 RepID=A0A6H1WSP4_9BACT|nr:carbamoyltransferase HypF [Thermosulfurimonas marina]QJA06174.1 carbamoyltransferase HypF [Thermosulfurimonas marina]
MGKVSSRIKGRRFVLQGRVQGVGFRPFVARLAARLDLKGWVRNGPEGVELAVWGTPRALSAFSASLISELPPLARLQRLRVRGLSEPPPEGFAIVETRQGPSHTLAPPDVATCQACLSEILDPGDRRFGYPFTNCTDCGPRYTVIEALPYDRPKTSMRSFEMCPECLAEYRDPRSRRFHAEPNACPVCGPQIWLCDARGERIPVADPLAFVVRTLREGALWALKGLGGFHLVCDAQNEAAVRLLRERKRRPKKPLAVMVRDLAAARKIAELTPAEEHWLSSPEAPIVLARKRRPFPLAESVAPGLHLVGLLLPYTPLHHLLLRAWPGLALVMTSGNLSEEPLCYRNEEALSRLSGVADYFLLHDRPIVAPVDDSVLRLCGDRPVLLRRARGFVPEPLSLPRRAPGTLAVGPLLKNTFTVTREDQALMSPHLGDLESLPILRRFEETLTHYRRLFDLPLEQVVCDLHPDYLSTRLAEERAQKEGLRLLKVQHHLAHALSALGESAEEPALALVLDGAGLGEDGLIRGGEIYLVEGPVFRRLGSLSPVPLPGGQAAEREPWRMLLAYLSFFTEEVPEPLRKIPAEKLEVARRVLSRGPLTTGAGRLFEALGCLLSGETVNHYEGELAARLEALAAEGVGERPYQVAPRRERKGVQLPAWEFVREALRDLRAGVPPEEVAARFHRGLAQSLARVLSELSEKTGLRRVVLSGGCFQNALFLEETLSALEKYGLFPVFNSRIPPNDGGLSYGQAVYASLSRASAQRS